MKSRRIGAGIGIHGLPDDMSLPVFRPFSWPCGQISEKDRQETVFGSTRCDLLTGYIHVDHPQHEQDGRDDAEDAETDEGRICIESFWRQYC